MEAYESNTITNDETLEDLQKKIKAHLKYILPEDAYDIWIDNFVFEQIDENQIVVGYYGTEPLKKFNREYKEEVWIHICSIVGMSRKFKIYKRKIKKTSTRSPKVKKHMKTAKLFVISMFFAVIALAFIVVMCNYISNRNFRESFYGVSSLKINNGIRVIQLSDLHNCTFGKENEQIIDRVEKLEPDIIICTGDMVDSDKNKMDEVVELCARLAEIAPSYYIYGNNEVEKIYDFPLNGKAIDKEFGFDDENRDSSMLLQIEDSFEEKIEKSGMKVLKNEMDSITVGTTKVDVFGVLTSNPSAFWNYTYESFEEFISSNPENLKITAVHEPNLFEETEMDFWGDLMLCGHTHGGTVRVPVLGPLYTHERGLFPERKGYYAYGRYSVDGKPLIVSAGMEKDTLLRINNQPELVVVDINKF
jgi:predicted MPP superfamily phosphohydrolase